MISGLSISNIGIVIIFGTFVISMLPSSPFRTFISVLDSYPYLSYVNWFVPVTEMLSILEVWLVAVTSYILVSLIARWVKLVG